jgi:growth factor-regulated tyrosine kinase substrate
LNDQAKKEQEELERAIAASLAEANKGNNSGSGGHTSRPAAKTTSRGRPLEDNEEDEDLKAAIEASLRELKVSEDRRNQQQSSGGGSDGGYGFNGYTRDSAFVSSASDAISVPSNPNQLSRTEIDNLKLFADLVERMEADVNARGIGVMSHSQISVSLTVKLFALV